MTTLCFIAVYFLIFASEILAQTPTSSSPPICANSNYQLTPSQRQTILDTFNQVRQTVKNGQMLLVNGQYALPAEEMPELTWDCEKEEELHQYLQDACDAFPYGPSTAYPSTSWSFMEMDVSSNDAFLQNRFLNVTLMSDFGLYTTTDMTRSTYVTSLPALDIYHDNAEKVGCALFTCDVGSKPGNAYPGNAMTRILCSVDPKVHLGEQLYEVSSAATSYVPPSQDVICTNSQTSIFKIETREMIMAKINEIRSKISAGTYQLENLDFAVSAASALNNLIWSCEDEAALFAAPNYLSCDDDSWYDHATEFQKFFQPTATWLTENDFKGYIQELIDEFFVSNPNFNFLSHSSAYATQYPAALALSDQATTFACNIKYCYSNTPGHPDFHFICRAKSSTLNNGHLYQSV